MIRSDVFVTNFNLIHGRLMASLENERVLISQGLSLADQALVRTRTLEALRESSLADRETLLGLQRSLLQSDQEVEKARRKCARLESENSKAQIQSSIAADEIARLTTIVEQLSLLSTTTIPLQEQSELRSITTNPRTHSSSSGKIDKSPNSTCTSRQAKSEFQKWLGESKHLNETTSHNHAADEWKFGKGRPLRETLTSVEIHKLGHMSRVDVESLSIARQSRGASIDHVLEKTLSQQSHLYSTLKPDISAAIQVLMHDSPKKEELAVIKSDVFVNNTPHPFSSVSRTSAEKEGARPVGDKWDAERMKHHERLNRSLARIDNETIKLRTKEGVVKGKNWSGR